MKEILHILKKDVRRHWPEILISLVLLGLYVRLTIQVTPNRFGASPLWWLLLNAEWSKPLMIFFWIFLSVRVVQGETLVGDRQWWVTKPYEWWRLLAAKELFLVAFIGIPLFLVQLFLLHHFGFPIFRYFMGVLGMQFGLALILFLPSVALGSLTRSLGQALLGVLVIFVLFWATFTILEKVPSSGMSSAVPDHGEITGLLIVASIIGAIGWQYARRRTWAARGLVAAAYVLVVLLGALTPYARFVDRKYPVLEGAEAPVRFTVALLKPSVKKRNDLSELTPDVYFRIHLLVSGIPEGHVVLLDGIKVAVETVGGITLDPGWKPQYDPLWKESRDEMIVSSVKREDYEKIKTEKVRIHLELALTEFQESEVRDLVLQEGEFRDPKLGICRLNDKVASQLDCRRPFRSPGLMATFDPGKANCVVETEDDQVPDDQVSHVWLGAQDDDSTEPGLNPVTDYTLGFGTRNWMFPSGDRVKIRPKVAHLCPGASVKLAKPEEKRHARVKLEISDVRLADLVGLQFASD
jgi:hypothetical protein